jgi:hypothetical protein
MKAKIEKLTKEGGRMEVINIEELVKALCKYPWSTFIYTPGKQLITGDHNVGGTIDWFNDTVDKIANYLYRLYSWNSRMDVVLWDAYCCVANKYFIVNWQDEVVSQVDLLMSDWVKAMKEHYKQRLKALDEIAKLILPYVSPVHPLRELFTK